MSVKLLWFHLMPYTELPADFRDKHPSIWVDIHSSLFDPKRAHLMYNDFMDELEHAAECGFDAVCVNEHHSNGYGLMPSPNLIATALARRSWPGGWSGSRSSARTRACRTACARACAGVSSTSAPPTVKASAPRLAPFMKARRSMASTVSSLAAARPHPLWSRTCERERQAARRIKRHARRPQAVAIATSPWFCFPPHG